MADRIVLITDFGRDQVQAVELGGLFDHTVAIMAVSLQPVQAAVAISGFGIVEIGQQVDVFIETAGNGAVAGQIQPVENIIADFSTGQDDVTIAHVMINLQEAGVAAVTIFIPFPDVVRALRQATRRSIEENHLEIAITRTQFTEDNAGGRQQHSVTPAPFLGRIVPVKQQVRYDRNEAGPFIETRWMLIAVHYADMRAEPDVVDVFKADGRSFRVARVIPRRLNGELYAVHAMLQEEF